SSAITPAATMASTSTTVKRRRGNPSAAVVTRTADPIARTPLRRRRGCCPGGDKVYHNGDPNIGPIDPPATGRLRRLRLDGSRGQFHDRADENCAAKIRADG